MSGNYAADQCLCFHYIESSLYFLNSKFQASGCTVCVQRLETLKISFLIMRTYSFYPKERASNDAANFTPDIFFRAANSIWSSDIFEYYCVDESGHMNKLARLLLQGNGIGAA